MFDVVVTSPDGRRSATIQVKTRSIHNKQGWKFGANIADKSTAKGQFVVLVNLQDRLLPDFYVYTRAEIAKRVSENYAEYIAKPKRDGTPKKSVGFRWFDERNFRPTDRAKKNNWSPILKALGIDNPS